MERKDISESENLVKNEMHKANELAEILNNKISLSNNALITEWTLGIIFFNCDNL